MMKIAFRMLMLVMAFAVSQATWADKKDKGHTGRPGWGATHQNGQHKGFNQAKWDSILAAHPNLAHRMDSIKAHRPDPRHFGHKNDSVRGHRPIGMRRPQFGRRPMPMHPQFGRRPMPMHPQFGPRRFAHRPFGPRYAWMHRPHGQKVATPETVAEEVKASEMDATAITETRQATTAPTYDLSGRKVSGQQNGIVIKGGRKYVK